MAGTYRFLCYSLAVDFGAGFTETLLGELPFGNVQFSQKLNGAGTFTGTMNVDDPASGFDPVTATAPMKTALYVERDGVLVWGGIITQRHRKGSARQITITATEFWWYYSRRILGQYNATVGTDILAIARGVMTQPGVTLASIGVVIGSETSGQTLPTEFIVNWWELRTASDVIETLAKMQISPDTGAALGFDFAIDVAYGTSGIPTKTFTLSYPRRGRIAGSTGLMFDLSSQALEYDWPEDGAQMTNWVSVAGQGQGLSQVFGGAIDATNVVPGGYPFYQAYLSFKDITDYIILNAQGASYVAIRALPLNLPDITFTASADNITGVTLGQFIIGDDARVYLPPDVTLFPQGIDGYYRIIASTVTLANDGGLETIRLTFNPAS